MMKEFKTDLKTFSQRQAAQQKKKQWNQKTRQQYKRKTLQQTNPEQCNAENTTVSSSSSIVNTSLLPTALYQAVKHFDRESASCHSNSKIHGCNSFRFRFLAKKPYHYALLVSLPGYINYAKEMKAIG